MKFRTYGMILILLFALGLVFSFGIETSANHGSTGIAAEDVDPTDKAEVENFLDHIIKFYNESYVLTDDRNTQDRKLAVYGRQIREDTGVYFHSGNNMYSMGINEDGIVTNHAGHPGKYGYEFDKDASGSAVASTIQNLIDGSDVSSTECETYGDQDRVACAIEVDSPSGKVTVIAGLHHAENDSAFKFPDCTDLNQFKPSNYTSAADVRDRESLKNYVEGVIEISEKLLTKVGTDLFGEHPALFGAILSGNPTDEQVAEAGKLTSQRLFQKIACLSNEDPSKGPVLNHGAIYSFIMGADPDATVLINGNNPALNGLDLQVNDPNPIDGAKANIAELIRDAITDDQGTLTDDQGNSYKAEGVFVEYHWDDPTTDADNNEGWFERKEVPGNSRKISYVRAANINTSGIGPDSIYIFGSGIYLMDGGDGNGGDGNGGDGNGGDGTPTSVSSDGGCAIAGAGNTSQGTLLNLLLTASVLFSAVFLRRRV